MGELQQAVGDAAAGAQKQMPPTAGQGSGGCQTPQQQQEQEVAVAGELEANRLCEAGPRTAAGGDPL